MKKLKIAYSENALQAFGAVDGREIIDVNNTDYTDVAAVVITEQDSDVLKNHKPPVKRVVCRRAISPYHYDQRLKALAFTLFKPLCPSYSATP